MKKLLIFSLLGILTACDSSADTFTYDDKTMKIDDFIDSATETCTIDALNYYLPEGFDKDSKATKIMVDGVRKYCQCGNHFIAGNLRGKHFKTRYDLNNYIESLKPESNAKCSHLMDNLIEDMKSMLN